jgi:hypothetical protein
MALTVILRPGHIAQLLRPFGSRLGRNGVELAWETLPCRTALTLMAPVLYD